MKREGRVAEQRRMSWWTRLAAGISLTWVPLLGCSSAAPETKTAAETQPFAASLDPRRSLAVTDQPILARFALKRVLDQLVAQSGVGGLTSVGLFQQWWDVLNPKPGLGRGPHCDDQVDAGAPALNGFPYGCRPAPSEGAQATCDPFVPGSSCAYIPIGLFNRFDLMPENGSSCGEYRIVYAKQTGLANTDDRNLVIFEAAMPNPLPLLGIEGCGGVVQFWSDLSSIDDVETRARELERFYFEGLIDVPIVPPVIHVDHFGDNAQGLGQIRTNQFVNPDPRIWSLREFKLRRSCGLLSCSSLLFVPVTAKQNPFGPLFSPGSTHAKAAAFQQFLPGQVAALSGKTIPDIDENIPDTYNSAQSQASGDTETNYPVQLGVDASPLRDALATQAASQALTADDIVNRVQALSCAGCHRLSNNVSLGGGLVWPPSLGFTHVTERETEVVDGITRFVLSEALGTAFLPHRMDVLQRYLSRTLLLKLIPLRPIGGFLVH